VEWILDGVDKTKGVQTKEILFRDIGFDLTADQKVAEENSAWYDLEAVTMPFPSDSGKKWCEVAVRMRKVFETMRRRLQGPIESIQHSHTTVPTDMKIKKFRQDTKQVEILSKKLLGEHHRLKIDPVVKAVFPSPIVMGVNSNYEEFSKLDIVKQYGILGTPHTYILCCSLHITDNATKAHTHIHTQDVLNSPSPYERKDYFTSL